MIFFFFFFVASAVGTARSLLFNLQVIAEWLCLVSCEGRGVLVGGGGEFNIAKMPWECNSPCATRRRCLRRSCSGHSL